MQRQPAAPKIRTVKASDARQNFSGIVNKVFHGDTRFVVERSGIPVAAIISAADLALLRQAEQQRQHDFEVLNEITSAFDDVPSAELDSEVQKALATVRGRRASIRAR